MGSFKGHSKTEKKSAISPQLLAALVSPAKPAPLYHSLTHIKSSLIFKQLIHQTQKAFYLIFNLGLKQLKLFVEHIFQLHLNVLNLDWRELSFWCCYQNIRWTQMNSSLLKSTPHLSFQNHHLKRLKKYSRQNLPIAMPPRKCLIS